MKAFLLAVLCTAVSSLAFADLVTDVSETGSATVGDFLFKGLKNGVDVPSNTHDDFMLWGGSSHSSNLPIGPPEDLPGGSTSSYPTAGNGDGAITMSQLRSVFVTPAGGILDDFDVFIDVNEPGGSKKPLIISTLQMIITPTVGPAVTYTIETTPPTSANDARLLNESQAGTSDADYMFSVVGGMGLSQFDPSAVVTFNLALKEIENGAEFFWAERERGRFVMSGLDFGDLPAQFGATTLADDGARHPDGSHEWLGSQWDGEADGVPCASAMTDDSGSPDDEDGVRFVDGGAWVSLAVADWEDTGRYNDDDYDAQLDIYPHHIYLDGWIDLDQDYTFDEGVADTDHVVSAHFNPATWGTNTPDPIFFAIPGFKPGYVNGEGFYSRWRLNYGGPTGWKGEAPFGEVEDYYITPEPATILLVGGGLALLARRRRRR